MYQLLESATDQCEDVANIIEGVVLETRLMIDGSIAFTALVLLVALALVFDFLNGFHDAANSIATVVSTGVLRPYQAVIWAAFFNFLAIAHLRAEGRGDGRQGHHRRRSSSMRT